MNKMLIVDSRIAPELYESVREEATAQGSAVAVFTLRGELQDMRIESDDIAAYCEGIDLGCCVEDSEEMLPQQFAAHAATALAEWIDAHDWRLHAIVVGETRHEQDEVLHKARNHRLFPMQTQYWVCRPDGRLEYC